MYKRDLLTGRPTYWESGGHLHYENMPMQYIENVFDIFLIFAQNIDCGYTLEPPRRGGSNEYPQSMFWGKNKKNKYTPAHPSFTI